MNSLLRNGKKNVKHSSVGLEPRKMDRVDAGRICAVAALLGLSAAILQCACLRSSTIYFFELETTRVLFLDLHEAVAFPLLLSAVLAIFYVFTKRVAVVEEQRKAALSITSSAPSVVSSRKISRSGDLPCIKEETADSRLLRRLLTEIKEDQDNPVSARSSEDDAKKSSTETSESEEKIESKEEPSTLPSTSSSDLKTPEEPRRAQSESRTLPTTEPVLFTAQVNTDDEEEIPRRRTSSTPAPDARLRIIQQYDDSRRSSRKNSVDRELTDEKRCEIYKSLGQMDAISFSLSFLNLLPLERSSTAPASYSPGQKLRLRLGDILAELVAVHLPIWASVAALHVVLLELFHIKFAYYFYYHEETMAYTALVASLAFGVAHEFIGGWLTNDVLALAHVYVIVSRVQAVSFHSGLALLIGMALFDLFWLYVVDLLSTVTTRTRAPLMLQIPRDNTGNKQSLATLDLIVPGVYMNILLKYSSMYDPGLYMLSFEAVLAGLLLTSIIAIYRRKVTPAMVIPSLFAVATAAVFATHPRDLWRFAVKH